MKIISNCPLCEEHSLHIIGEDELQTQQCINCGYVTSEKLKLNGRVKEEHLEYNKLTDEMKDWSKVENDRLWLPTMMILPSGALHPMSDKDKNMKWAFSPMVDVTEEEREKYPREDGKGFHTQKIDTDNPKIYDSFFEAISEINKQRKKENSKPKETKIKLPRLKKIK